MSKSHLGFHHICGAKLRANKLVRQTFASHFIRILIKVFILRNIYVFVDTLLTFQTSAYIKMTTAKKNVSKHVSV
jgi:hypothetical protein